MPNINLIAQKREEKARLERAIRRMFFLMSGLFITAILLFTVISAQWFSIKGDINAMDDELTKLQPMVDKIKDFESRTRELGPKIELYGQSREHTLRWYSYLQIVARSLPDNTWLTRVSTAASSAHAGSETTVANASVNIAGVTLNQDLVGETMMRLNRFQTSLDKVDLSYTRSASMGGTPTVEFEIVTQISDLPASFVDKLTARKSTEEGDVDAKS